MRTFALTLNRSYRRSLILDLAAIAFVYFIPSLSHLFNLPVYFIEPMRLMIVLAMAYTHKNNAYILALTLPMFSYLVSGHPYILKTALISIELIFNVWLFYKLAGIMRSAFLSMLTAIIISKLVYYFLKAALISLTFIHSELFSTPILMQILMTLLFSGYVFIRARKAD